MDVKCLNPLDVQCKHIVTPDGISESICAGEKRWGSLPPNVCYEVPMNVKAYDMRFIQDIGDKAMALLSTMHKGANANGCSIVCYEDHTNMKVFNESGHGYWLEGFGCLRADGGFNDSNTSHAVCYAVYDARGNGEGGGGSNDHRRPSEQSN